MLDLRSTGGSRDTLPGQFAGDAPGAGAQFFIAEDPDDNCWRAYVQQCHRRYRISPLRFMSKAAANRWFDRFLPRVTAHWIDAWVRNAPLYFNHTPESYRENGPYCMSCTIAGRGPCMNFIPGDPRFSEKA